MVNIKFILLSNVLVFLFFFPANLAAQENPAPERISLLTCGPGDELYFAWGHSALRVYNPLTGADTVYNWGVFDFATPNFYLKFMRGKLLYFMGKEPTRRFLYPYRATDRWVYELPLDLRPEDKAEVLNFLQENYKPENRYYLYDFFFDNCATRIRDMLRSTMDLKAVEVPDMQEKTLRDLLHEYLEQRPWTRFGIDLILGVPSDQPATFENAMFLPDYLEDHIQHYRHNDLSITRDRREILPIQRVKKKPRWLTPTCLFWGLLTFFVALSWFAPKSMILKLLDTSLFLAAGLGGLLILVMWLGTDHLATKVNLNLLWLNPFYLFSIGYIWRTKGKMGWIIWIAAVLSAVTLIFSFLLPQAFHPAIFPIGLSLILRAVLRTRVGAILMERK